MSAFTIISETNSTQASLKSLFDFLSDFKNFGSILPEDKVENFQYSETECSFNIKGITPMKIKKTEAKPYEHILFSSEGLAKFNFSLKVFFIGEAEKNGSCKIELMGDLNPFIKAMAEKPLTALTNTMSLKLAQLNLK
ncbi:MAG: hypothetical protein ABIP51_07755 [Bacteroidia bacterium]